MTNFTTATIITGAASGIGLAIAKSLFASGSSIVLNDLDEALLLEVHQAVFDGSENVCLVAGNTADTAIRKQLVDECYHHFGKIDYLVANAGKTLFAPFLETTEAVFNQLMDVNLKATFFLVQEAVNQSLSHKIPLQSILLLSSVTGIQAHANLTAYGMTKAAIALMARNLVAELAPMGIRINAISPGATITDRTNFEEFTNTWSQITPLGKPASAEEISSVASFILKATHITGQNIVVDGGWTAISPPPL